ncbi:unnamed protein product [Dibothriocephalus latus]|uniref:Uncharacterized protein n=1 Tax=Dibothriocephalus latus TaxID=60516 RepID=A0A3P6R8C3_DIBLA|nr:unnamed protein product [Dibothriocephalus latus]
MAQCGMGPDARSVCEELKYEEVTTELGLRLLKTFLSAVRDAFSITSNAMHNTDDHQILRWSLTSSQNIVSVMLRLYDTFKRNVLTGVLTSRREELDEARVRY